MVAVKIHKTSSIFLNTQRKFQIRQDVKNQIFKTKNLLNSSHLRQDLNLQSTTSYI